MFLDVANVSSAIVDTTSTIGEKYPPRSVFKCFIISVLVKCALSQAFPVEVCDDKFGGIGLDEVGA